jgi:hemerythrin-like domain-containing protein
MMSQAVDELAAGDPSAARRWASAAREYAPLLRAHLNKENSILFVMAERLLSDAEQIALAEAFEMREIDQIGAGTHQRLHGSMKELLEEIFAGTAAAR